MILLLLILFAAIGGINGECNVIDYGAKGDGKTLDTAAIQHTINVCDSILLPKGFKFLSAPFNLTSDRVFTVNGVLLAVTDPDLWPVVAHCLLIQSQWRTMEI